MLDIWTIAICLIAVTTIVSLAVQSIKLRRKERQRRRRILNRYRD